MKKAKSPLVESSLNSDMYLLAIASSAGGLKAFSNLFEKLPSSKSLNLAIIVAQRLSPSQQSHLVSLLAKESQWQIREATNAAKLEKGIIYITPPDRDILIEDKTILLTKPSASVESKPLADLLFKTVAQDFKKKAIALVLSGSGKDGLLGLKEISKFGGITLGQKPETDASTGRPNAALESKLITRIITANEMGEVLNEICSVKRLKPNIAAADTHNELAALEKIFDLLQKKSGVDFSQYKLNTIQRRLESRINMIQKSNLEDIKYIEKNPSEVDDLFKHVLIGVTHFFRDPLAFDELEKNLRKLIEAKSEKTLRIWHPGCASGEEAYSTSILIHEILGDDIEFWDVQIFATDIDETAITIGRKGEFAPSSLALMDNKLVNKYFTLSNDFVKVNKELRAIVLFSRHDLTSKPPFLKLDLVSCRNLLIYFDVELQKRIVAIFHYALKEGALLFLGNCESLGTQSDLFSAINKTYKIWSRKKGKRIVSPQFSISSTAATLKLLHHKVSFANKSIPERVEETLISSFIKPYVVISESYEIQYVSGNVQSFLQFNPGAMSTNILRQCKKDLEIILGQTIQRAIKTSESTYSAPRQLKNKENFELFRFLVHPMLHFKETHYLVIYESMAVEYQAITTEKVSNKEFENIQVSELQLELANTREHLKSYIEELETSNEEMQALNEELQSTNEELQSVNDELETSNEEIQSAHAKMQGAYKVLNEVNDLIRLKEKEMLKANAQLESILNNDSQGLILCNENFEILHFNQYAYNAIAGINGQKIKVKNGLLSYLPKQWVGDFIDLVKMSISSDIDSKKQLTIELKSGEKQHFIVSLSPVQSNLPEGPKITISLLNNTEEFQLNEHLDQMNKLLDQVSDVVKIGGWELDVKTLKITWTKGVYDIHQVGHAFQTDLNVSLDFYEDKDRLEMKRLINNTIKTGKSFEGSFNFRDALKNQMLVEVKGFPRFRNGEMQSVWGTIQDITETQVQQQQNETKNRELTRSNKELEEFAYIASHDLQEPLRMIYSFIEILEDQYKDSFDDDGKQYLGFITNGARRMQAMLSDLLVYSRVSDNHESFKLVNLDVLIKEVLINLETSIIAKKSMVDISELAAIKGVPSLLSRLFQNLIANSIKYNNRIPQISIWCEKSKKKENHISLYIKDNGIGIDSTHFQHIFGIFKRLHTEQEYPGSGIGLAICKRIMIKHDGDIEVLNSSNEGTVFHLDFIAYEQ